MTSRPVLLAVLVPALLCASGAAVAVAQGGSPVAHVVPATPAPSPAPSPTPVPAGSSVMTFWVGPSGSPPG